MSRSIHKGCSDEMIVKTRLQMSKTHGPFVYIFSSNQKHMVHLLTAFHKTAYSITYRIREVFIHKQSSFQVNFIITWLLTQLPSNCIIFYVCTFFAASLLFNISWQKHWYGNIEKRWYYCKYYSNPCTVFFFIIKVAQGSSSSSPSWF